MEKTKGRKTPNLKDMKDKTKTGAGDWLKNPKENVNLLSCAGKTFLQGWRVFVYTMITASWVSTGCIQLSTAFIIIQSPPCEGTNY